VLLVGTVVHRVINLRLHQKTFLESYSQVKNMTVLSVVND